MTIDNKSNDRAESLSVKETIIKYKDPIKKWFKPEKKDTWYKTAIAYLYPATLIIITVGVLAVYFFVL